mmetsp:Transcript_20454/g.30367  ORF Transcript_20454/g.30367 Transcript_20454/m.30367 type:complete len:234 (-) Transcript_20454:1174-1875(-)
MTRQSPTILRLNTVQTRKGIMKIRINARVAAVSKVLRKMTHITRLRLRLRLSLCTIITFTTMRVMSNSMIYNLMYKHGAAEERSLSLPRNDTQKRFNKTKAIDERNLNLLAPRSDTQRRLNSPKAIRKEIRTNKQFILSTLWTWAMLRPTAVIDPKTELKDLERKKGAGKKMSQTGIRKKIVQIMKSNRLRKIRTRKTIQILAKHPLIQTWLSTMISRQIFDLTRLGSNMKRH